MTEWINSAVRDHPLTAALLGILFLLLSPLTVAHTVRIFVRFFVSVMEEYRHEYTGLRELGNDIRREVQKWRGDP